MASTPVGTTIGTVLNTMAYGRYEPFPGRRVRASDFNHVVSLHAEAVEDPIPSNARQMQLQQGIASDALNRVLAGIR